MGKSRQYKKLRLKEEAAKVPIVMRATREKHLYLGKQLLDDGITTTISGAPIKPDELQEYFAPVQIAVNHKRNLKKAVLKYGKEGISAYKEHVLNHHQNT